MTQTTPDQASPLLLRKIQGISATILRHGFLRYVQIQRRKFAFTECWFLAIRQKEPGTFWESTRPFDLIIPPPGKCYADPCVIKANGTNILFFEEYDLRTKKGSIACAPIERSGVLVEPETVLEKDYHLSYPFVFEWQGDVYMVPESSANRTIELYRAAEFPHRWELIRILMGNLKAADTTICFHRDR